MKKYIHYCWFGNNPLPKLAKKCIKSWQKYLPDYEIIRWDETNFDVNMTDFSKKAYKAKKWAFVADVARLYALKKYGGIYFDTDMLITSNIDFLLEDEVFVGWESKDFVACGVLGVKSPNNELIEYLWEKYERLTFDESSLHAFSIPKVLTGVLRRKYGLENDYLRNQRLKDGVHVYSRDYFYPLSYDHRDNLFTENTCMIHYYDASWISKPEKRLIKVYRILGREKGDKMIAELRQIKSMLKKIAKVILFPVVNIRNRRRHSKYLISLEDKTKERLAKVGKGGAVVICHPHWLGIKYATQEISENIVYMEELYQREHIKKLAQIIVQAEPRIIIFSGLAQGWDLLIREIREIEHSIKIKILWHGSNSMHIESYDWDSFKRMFSLYDDKLVDSLGFVKKSMAEFYKAKGYNAEFVTNNVHLNSKKLPKKNWRKGDKVKIGLYASGDRWVKNFYNQIAATSLIEEAEVECIPISMKVYEFADILDLKVTGERDVLPRKELFKRMAKNDINIYVTFVECAPLLPLESFELGVPCITGNNHHYWENHELRDYVVVDEVDNVIKIYEKIIYCLENREKVLNLYFDWKEKYDRETLVRNDKFLK
jgi:hypothetical protein